MRHDPRDARARYGLGMIAMCPGRGRAGAPAFRAGAGGRPGPLPRPAAIAPSCWPGRGDWDAATREINACLGREPRSPATLYAAACVVARAYGALGSDATAAQALDLLERAVAEGADPSRADDDPDLAAIRRLPRFRRLVERRAGPAAAPSARAAPDNALRP